MSTPGQLYDALFAFESRVRRGKYPIHKRLRFAEPGIDHTYAWITEHHELPSTGTILDAGCGVAYGTLHLAMQSDAAVIGISVSDAEVRQSKKNVTDTGMDARVEIRHRSYDDVEEHAFDMVVAVESLKHSCDLGKSIGSLVRALKPKGRLVVIEDLYIGPEDHPSAVQVAADWLLLRNYREADYIDELHSGPTRVTDLTGRVRIPGHASLSATMLAINAWLAIAPRNRSAAMRAFRGGLHLQRLYAGGLMHYKSIEFTKQAPAKVPRSA